MVPSQAPGRTDGQTCHSVVDIAVFVVGDSKPIEPQSRDLQLFVLRRLRVRVVCSTTRY